MAQLVRLDAPPKVSPINFPVADNDSLNCFFIYATSMFKLVVDDLLISCILENNILNILQNYESLQIKLHKSRHGNNPPGTVECAMSMSVNSCFIKPGFGVDK